MVWMMITLCLLSMTLTSLNYLIMMSMKKIREKTSTFECGFEPMMNPRLPFSMHFFLIALIFLIFDVEISLISPIPLMWSIMKPHYLFWSLTMALTILIMGTLVEWVEDSLEWHM